MPGRLVSALRRGRGKRDKPRDAQSYEHREISARRPPFHRLIKHVEFPSVARRQGHPIRGRMRRSCGVGLARAVRRDRTTLGLGPIGSMGPSPSSTGDKGDRSVLLAGNEQRLPEFTDRRWIPKNSELLQNVRSPAVRSCLGCCFGMEECYGAGTFYGQAFAPTHRVINHSLKVRDGVPEAPQPHEGGGAPSDFYSARSAAARCTTPSVAFLTAALAATRGSRTVQPITTGITSRTMGNCTVMPAMIAMASGCNI